MHADRRASCSNFRNFLAEEAVALAPGLPAGPCAPVLDGIPCGGDAGVASEIGARPAYTPKACPEGALTGAVVLFSNVLTPPTGVRTPCGRIRRPGRRGSGRRHACETARPAAVAACNPLSAAMGALVGQGSCLPRCWLVPATSPESSSSATNAACRDFDICNAQKR